VCSNCVQCTVSHPQSWLEGHCSWDIVVTTLIPQDVSVYVTSKPRQTCIFLGLGLTDSPLIMQFYVNLILCRAAVLWLSRWCVMERVCWAWWTMQQGRTWKQVRPWPLPP
jgi:hypothetical protein